jgi:hypothetical protein
MWILNASVGVDSLRNMAGTGRIHPKGLVDGKRRDRDREATPIDHRGDEYGSEGEHSPDGYGEVLQN